MVLSFSHQVMLSVSLALCACVIVPRIFGGGGGGRSDMSQKPDPRRMAAIHAQPFRESHGKDRMHGGGHDRKSYTSAEQIKKAMEQELKPEKTSGSGRSLAFTLMPLYAVGVAVFAAYKFTKLKTKEKSRSKIEEEANKKSKETENQLLQLERHLLQTEQMLNSLLTQLDPLSNCVNTLANGQRDEIMNQLQSIRQLMKESGMDKSALINSANQTCEDTLEDLMYSFEEQESDLDDGNNNDDVERETEERSADPIDANIIQHNDCSESAHGYSAGNSLGVEDEELFDADVTSNHNSNILRKRILRE
ncbi:coiled-coil domain-containing protein 107-like [Spea bombifrons]|uniref:coiled-coil domain-containing protein 107-like n=1 Tax=Spea bombifrons TaxID=233779 RepID=UPI00234B1E32|nr:coiled-coil domain-containing protein 107-like [Spea bombifrons]